MEETKVTETAETVSPAVITEEIQPITEEHKHDEHPSEPSLRQAAPPEMLNERDMRRLAFNGYDKAKKKFQNTYLLQNKKNGKIAEIKAASTVHACTLLGWNPKKVRLIAFHEPDGKTPPVETVENAEKSEKTEGIEEAKNVELPIVQSASPVKADE